MEKTKQGLKSAAELASDAYWNGLRELSRAIAAQKRLGELWWELTHHMENRVVTTSPGEQIPATPEVRQEVLEQIAHTERYLFQAGVVQEAGQQALVNLRLALRHLMAVDLPAGPLRPLGRPSRASVLRRPETAAEGRRRAAISVRPYSGDLGFWGRARRRLACLLKGHERRFPVMEASGVGTGFRCRRCGRMLW